MTIIEMNSLKLALLLICGICSCNTTPVKDEPLDKRDCTRIKQEILSQWKASQADALKHNLEEKAIHYNGDTMPFDVQTFGREPEGGRSLWISLHGGGGTTKEVNDGQWDNQTKLYKPKDCYYICPRAPWDAWDMWFQAPIDPMFEELVRTMTVCCGINPDKVYILGYSAGGDGIWRLAPRMADHWAAAAMMAGHPGGVRLENVRNLPFTIWVGGDDEAYNRNIEVAKRGEVLDSLRNQDQGGYIHETHVLEGLGHWMEHRDTAALSWMAAYTRDPHPTKVVWRQEEVTRQYFYWLEAPVDELAPGKTVMAEINGNRIDISRCDYSSITVYLDDDMVDLDAPVEICVNGGKSFTFEVERLSETLKETLSKRGDPAYMFPSRITLKIQ